MFSKLQTAPTEVQHPIGAETGTVRKPWRPSIRLSLDWTAFLVALIAAAAVRFGIIGSVPW
jgi:hypothetical protein